jgi:hypothetical protein
MAQSAASTAVSTAAPAAPVAPAAAAGPSRAGRGFIIGLLWFAAIATVAYWVIWFCVDRSWLATASTPEYFTFENAFPVSDGWLVVTSALGAVALQRRRASALFWMLLGGSAAIYLAGMDILFDLENGIYRSADAGSVAVELFINLGFLVGGPLVVLFAWRHRTYFLSLERSP